MSFSVIPPAKGNELHFHNVGEGEIKESIRKREATNKRLAAVAKECYDCHTHESPEWRHARNEKGEWLRDKSNNQVWVCNKCGLKRARKFSQQTETKRKMSLDSIVHKEREEPSPKKLSLDSLRSRKEREASKEELDAIEGLEKLNDDAP